MKPPKARTYSMQLYVGALEKCIETWQIVQQIPHYEIIVGELLFRQIFEIAPDALSLYSFGEAFAVDGNTVKVPEDVFSLEAFQLHAKGVVTMLENVLVMMLKGQYEDLALGIRELGGRHISYGVHPAHYGIVEAALLRTLEGALLPAGHWNDDIRKGWAAVFKFVAKGMMNGAGSRLEITKQCRRLEELDKSATLRLEISTSKKNGIISASTRYSNPLMIRSNSMRPHTRFTHQTVSDYAPMTPTRQSPANNEHGTRFGKFFSDAQHDESPRSPTAPKRRSLPWSFRHKPIMEDLDNLDDEHPGSRQQHIPTQQSQRTRRRMWSDECSSSSSASLPKVPPRRSSLTSVTTRDDQEDGDSLSPRNTQANVLTAESPRIPQRHADPSYASSISKHHSTNECSRTRSTATASSTITPPRLPMRSIPVDDDGEQDICLQPPPEICVDYWYTPPPDDIRRDDYPYANDDETTSSSSNSPPAKDTTRTSSATLNAAHMDDNMEIAPTKPTQRMQEVQDTIDTLHLESHAARQPPICTNSPIRSPITKDDAILETTRLPTPSTRRNLLGEDQTPRPTTHNNNTTKMTSPSSMLAYKTSASLPPVPLRH